MSDSQLLDQPYSPADTAGPIAAHSHPPAGTLVPAMHFSDRDAAPPLPSGVISPDDVPAAPKPQPIPLIRAIMPIVMVVAIVAMVGLMFLSNGTINPMMLVFPIMMLMGIFMMFSPQPGEDTDEMRRTYLRHIGMIRQQARTHAEAQREHEFHNYPDPSDLVSKIGTNRMWERASDDPDFLTARIGLGTAGLCTPIEVSDPGATEDLDPVCAVSLRHAVQDVGIVTDMPVVIQLQAFSAVLLTGGDKAADLLRAMVAHIATFHGPDAVAIQARGDSFGWVKWLPHTNPQALDAAATSIVLIDDTVSPGAVSEILDEHAWTTVIAVNNRSVAVVDRAEEEGLVIHVGAELVVHTVSGGEAIGVPDGLGESEALILSRKITPFYRQLAPGDKTGGSLELPALLGVDDFNPDTIASLWQPRGKWRLRVPIGQDDRGRNLVIDIKESAHGGMGPHGLCVGATGSGKSELLRTLVVALAATHSPHDLNFVLVDFKGGATFLGLDGLPHTSAVITNLSEESVLVERMHDAISGEMNRRQELLRKAGNFANVTEYEAARRSDRPDLEPLPALFIVLDEFSELLGQHADFADLFVAVGRLGRSLHIHLLLASQRLEEGRLRGLDSHLSYRIGLKTFSAAESRQVLGVPDAYHLPSKPGAGYMKADADQLIRFQTAYVSGPLLRPHHVFSQQTGDRIKLWDGWEAIDDDADHTLVADPRGTLVDALVEAATTVARQRNQSAHQVWLPPLPPAIPISDVVASTSEKLNALTAPIGIIDRPFAQRQDTLFVDFNGQKGHACICGGPQTGKTTALRTIMVALAATHTTDDIRFYVLDLAGHDLDSMTMLPHVAGVAHRGETEKIERIIDEVTSFIDKPEPRHTFLVVDGWHVLHAEHETQLDTLGRIAADGLAANVHLLITTPRWTVVRPAIRDLIVQRLELKLSEPLDSLIDRKAQPKIPSAPGRGLSMAGESMLIAQSAQQDIAHVATISAAQPRVPALKMLPKRIELTELERHSDPRNVAIGVGGPLLGPLYWDTTTDQHFVCIGSQQSGKTATISTICQGLTELGRDAARLVVIDHRRSHLGEIAAEMLAGYSASSKETEKLLNQAAITLQERLPGSDITPEQLRARSWWSGPDIFIVIDDYDLLSDMLMAPLMPLMPHARDIGLHIVVGRKSGGAVRAFFQPFLSEIKDQTPMAVILDADKDDGPLFGIRTSAQPPGRGVLVAGGSTQGKIQVALVPTEDQGETK